MPYFSQPITIASFIFLLLAYHIFISKLYNLSFILTTTTFIVKVNVVSKTDDYFNFIKIIYY